MPATGTSPFECGGSGIADSARSLARTLRQAPYGESRERADLRRTLTEMAERTGDHWDSEPAPVESKRAFTYHKVVWQIRALAVELGSLQDPEPSGLQIVLEAFARQYRPDALVVLRPAGLVGILVREHLQRLRDNSEALGLDTLKIVAPGEFLLARYPMGEQNNTLMACSALHSFHRPRPSYVFAASTVGPAYFFALAAEIQNNKGFSDSFDAPKLCFVGELLEISGWMKHPQVGPLIARWRDKFGFDPGYLDRKMLSEPLLRSMRESQEAYRSAPGAYTPDDFDRETPAIWERLRNGLPPEQLLTGQDEVSRERCAVDILNAGWSFAQLHMATLHERLGSRTSVEQYDARVVLNGLLADGIRRSDALVA